MRLQVMKLALWLGTMEDQFFGSQHTRLIVLSNAFCFCSLWFILISTSSTSWGSAVRGCHRPLPERRVSARPRRLCYWPWKPLWHIAQLFRTAYNMGMEMALVNTDSLLTPSEAAPIVGVSRRRIQKLCQDGRLGCYIGGRWLIPKQEAVKFAKIPRQSGRPVSSKR